ncbi:hypothetical protein H0A65_00270 [Alcaligenaceae bacterium]|nr:hypothetical protein [Alcaligenaceae bacterium]
MNDHVDPPPEPNVPIPGPDEVPQPEQDDVQLPPSEVPVPSKDDKDTDPVPQRAN